MPNPEAALHSSFDSSFERARYDPRGDVPILALEAALNGRREPWSSEVAAMANEEGPSEVDHRPTKSCRTGNDVVMAR